MVRERREDLKPVECRDSLLLLGDDTARAVEGRNGALDTTDNLTDNVV